MERNDVSALVRVAAAVLASEWPGAEIEVDLLDPIRTGWGRHDLILCNALGPSGVPATVVVKAPVDRRSALFSEWAVHEWLAGDDRTRWCVPPFHGGDPTTPLIVIGDVGAGPSMHRLLQVRGAATTAVRAERELTAQVHGATRGRGGELDAVRRQLPAGPAPATPIVRVDEMLHELAQWDIPVERTLVDEVERLAGRLMIDDEDACLVFNDACPVNRIVSSEGVVAIDLEHAAFGHPAIDAAYPAIGHLACTTRVRRDEAIAWPLAARREAERAYRDEIVTWYPHWHDDRFTADLAAATAAWLVTILGRVRDRTIPDERWSRSRQVARGRVLSTLDAVLAVDERAEGLAGVARWASAARERCVERWPDAEPLATVAGLSPTPH